ncbi:MAG: efflux RND transporter permease subunit [Sphingomonas sp.]|jgi:multidrug efflux pump subunit AcrB|uniref:efflux RND transporter permease subunit n=1 Tax=Sphingomonas sp. TaxID=28214 RepID=UPI003567A2B4
MDLGLDERKSGLLGIAPGEARRALKLAIAGEVVSRMRDDEGDSWPVTVRLPMTINQPVSTFSNVYVPTLTGESVPLLSIARPRLKSVPEQISRYKLQRSVTITGYNQPGVLTSRLNSQVRAAMDDIRLPAGYHFDIGGEAEISTRSFARIGSSILLAAFGLVGVLVFEFGRFRETAVVVGVIPLGTFGGLVALFLTGNSLSFLAVIGFVALIGIEIKNSILLVDFAS